MYEYVVLGLRGNSGQYLALADHLTGHISSAEVYQHRDVAEEAKKRAERKYPNFKWQVNEHRIKTQYLGAF